MKAAARIAREEMGFEVFGIGCYNREFARPIRALAKDYGLEALISDDYLEVEAAIAEAAPELILGTQMERHIGKRLGIPCAVISAPVHVQDFPARYSPQMGWEGANVIFDTWVHPLVMGLEEHLLHMFRDDFEFHDAAGPSHHGGHAPKPVEETESEAARRRRSRSSRSSDRRHRRSGWRMPRRSSGRSPSSCAARPGGTPKRFAAEKGLAAITVETLYEAKAHYAR